MKKRFIKKQMDIAAQIYELIQQKGWTQGELAEKAGISEQRLSMLLSGHANPTLETLVKIENAFDRDVIVAPKFFKKSLYRNGFTITRKPITEKFSLDFSDSFTEVLKFNVVEKKSVSFEYTDKTYQMPVNRLRKIDCDQAA